MRRAAPTQRSKGEPTIALINVVFLMLVFFLVAGSLSPPLDPSISLVSLRDIEGRQPPYALLVHADGRVTWQNQEVEPGRFTMPQEAAEAPGHIRLIPDRDVPATRLLQVAAELRAAGAEQIYVVTERGLE